MFIVVSTGDFRGDHEADIEFLIQIDETLPISYLRRVSERHKLSSGMGATIKILPTVDAPQNHDSDE